MDWTKEKVKNYITIEETLEELAKGNLDLKDAKEVINATIDKIVEQAECDIKIVHACRNFLNAIGIESVGK